MFIDRYQQNFKPPELAETDVEAGCNGFDFDELPGAMTMQYGGMSKLSV